MSLLDDIQSLDINDIGRWPLAFRAVVIALIFAGVTFGGYWHFIKSQKQVELLRVEQQEEALRTEFQGKQHKAANLEAYKRQKTSMESKFGAMLRQLPAKTEIPSLLVDISQTGLASGLEEELFQPGNEELKNDFAAKPITIRLRGEYHELGQFASGIAALPRIVVLGDVEIEGDPKDDEADLTMSVIASTFRYLEEEEIQEAAAK